MKKRLLQMGAVILCIMMCLCGTISVFAEAWEPVTSGDGVTDGQIIVKIADDEKIPAEAGQSITADAYKIINVVFDNAAASGSDASYQPKQPVYTWNTAVAAWIRSQDKYKAFVGDGDAVTDAYSKLGDDAELVKAFVVDLGAAIKGGTVILASAGNGTVAADTRAATISGLTAGSYIVLVAGGTQVYNPMLANLAPVWQTKDEAAGIEKDGWYIQTPQTLNAKSKPVKITKEVKKEDDEGYENTASAQIGKTLDFKIEADVPQYPANAVSKIFKIQDTFSKGLDFVANSLKVYGVTGSGDAVTETLLTLGDAYRLEEVSGENAPTFKIVVDNYDKIAGYTTIKVTYKAILNKDAVVGVSGNINKAVLEYSNNPYEENSSKTDETESKVYTYGLEVEKVDKESNDTKLPGAVFQIKAQGETAVLQFVQIGTVVGSYRVATSGEIADTATVTTDRVITDANGKLNLSGLDSGTYEITEVEAPDGYVILKDAKSVTLTDAVKADGTHGKDGILENEDGENIAGNTGSISLTIENQKGFNLPLTGGMGTILFTAGGIVLVAGAVVLLLAANKKKSRRS